MKSVDPAPWWSYQPGDQVQGLVQIHTTLAPPDADPSVSLGDYAATAATHVNFVETRFGKFGITGPGPLPTYRTQDRVIVGNGNYYYARDSVELIRGSFHDLKETEIGVTRNNLVTGDDLTQQFDAIPAEDGSTLVGSIFRRLRQVAGKVTFTLTRVSLTPGMCRAK